MKRALAKHELGIAELARRIMIGVVSCKDGFEDLVRHVCTFKGWMMLFCVGDVSR